VGGGLVVGVVVVGGAVVGGVVVGGAVVGVDFAAGAVVGGVDVPLAGVFVAPGEVVVVAEPPAPEPAPAPAPVVGVGEVDADADADGDADDFPLERTANQSFSTPCPEASPFLSLTKRYSARPWKNTCRRPPCTRTAVNPLTPCGAFMCVTPLGNNTGGQTLAHAPVHVALPAGSTL
jgi:hypothetical protein